MAGRAFTEIAPSSDVLCRLAGTASFRLQPIGSSELRVGPCGATHGSCDLFSQDRYPAYPVKGLQLTIQNAFRRIRTPRAFARSLCLSAQSVKKTLRDARTVSPSTHRRSRQRIEVSFRLGRVARACLAARVRPRRWMRPNRLLPPYTLDYEHSRPVDSRRSLRGVYSLR